MDVLEAPPITNDDAPLGTLVILSLDPVASVADMNDPEASIAAAALPRGKYLALVFAPEFNGFAPLDPQPLAFQFYGIGHGVPHIRPNACIGLGPLATLPNGRAPLETSIPLPWTDCYVAFPCMFNAIVTRLHLAAPRCAIARSDILTVLNAKADAEIEDGFDQCTEIASDDGAPADDNDPPPLPSPSPSQSDGAGTCDRESVSVDYAVSMKPPSMSSSEWLNRLCYQPPRMRPRAEIWLDLNTTEDRDFRPPSELQETIWALYEIEEEWATRAAAALMVDRPRTNQWAADVAAVGSADPNDNALVAGLDVTRGFDDELVNPEDAVDYRAPEATEILTHFVLSSLPVTVQQPASVVNSGPRGFTKAKRNVSAAFRVFLMPLQKLSYSISRRLYHK